MSSTSPGELFVGIILGILVVSAVLGLLVTIGWNLGVVAVAAACGAHVAGISIFQGMGLTLLMMILSLLFRGGRVAS